MKGKDDDLFEWNPEAAFQELKEQLIQALALDLLNLAKPFDLYLPGRR